MSAIQSCADERSWCAQGYGLYNNYTGFIRRRRVSRITPKIAGAAGSTHDVRIAAEPAVEQRRHLQTRPMPDSPCSSTHAGTDVVPFAIGRQGWRGVGGNAMAATATPSTQNMTLYPEVKRATSFSHRRIRIHRQLRCLRRAVIWPGEGCQQPVRVPARMPPTPASVRTTPISESVSRGAERDRQPRRQRAVQRRQCLLQRGCFGGPGTVISKNWNPRTLQAVTTDTKVLAAWWA